MINHLYIKWTWKNITNSKNKTGYKFIAARDSARIVPVIISY